MSAPVDYAFLHGATQGGWVWADTIAALDRQTGGAYGRALALDAPGCGEKRGRATEGLGPDEIAAELVGEIEAAGLRDVVLVGHSMAGVVLPRMLELKPELFRRAIYVSCIAPLPGLKVVEWRSEVRAGTAAEDPPPWEAPSDQRQLMRTIFCNDMSREQADDFMGKLGPDDWPEKVMQVSDWRYDALGRPPATYVICLQDLAVTADWQDYFADRLKAGRRVRIDAAHQVMVTRPHALAEILRLEAAAPGP
jgi:pimeloyl-ACP methyl ester carboxylesterase